MSLTPLQKAAACAIVNIFETSTLRGDYGKVTLLSGDPGHLTYGRSQTTLTSGNLEKLIRRYVGMPGAKHADGMRPFLDELARKDLSLDHNQTFRSLLKQAGTDPVMQAAQDAFFDEVYWNPAVAAAEKVGICTPLGVAVVYDSTVHGSWTMIRNRTIQWTGKPQVIGEKAWITAYVDTRREWLATHKTIPILRKTVYRMDAFKAQIAAGNWDLALPFTIRGITLTADKLGVKDEPEAAWQIFYEGKALGAAWNNPDDGNRPYFPARAFVNAVAGGASAAQIGIVEGHLTHGGAALLHEKLPVKFLLRPTGPNGEKTAWAQVRGLASSLGMTLQVEDRKITVAWPTGKDGSL